jgi:hypothetical protein
MTDEITFNHHAIFLYFGLFPGSRRTVPMLLLKTRIKYNLFGKLLVIECLIKVALNGQLYQ